MGGIQVIGAPSGAVGDLLDFQYVPKTVDEPLTSSTTLQNDNELVLPVGANQTWEFEFVLKVYPVTNVPGLKVAFSVPAGASGFYVPIRQAEAPGSVPTWYAYGLTQEAVILHQSSGASGIVLKGLIINGATPGNLQLQWAQNVSSGDSVTVHVLSFLKAMRMR